MDTLVDLQDVKAFCELNEIPFEEKEDRIYIYGKTTNTFGREYRPYLRVSEDGYGFYVRDNGYCESMPGSVLLEKIKREYM